MIYDRLAEAVRLCAACALSTGGKGVPGIWVLPKDRPPLGGHRVASEHGPVVVLGEAPGGVEMAKGEPFVGDSGELLRSLLKEVGLTSYYLSNIAKCRPPVVKGKQQAPDKVTIEACAPFLRAELDLVKPAKLILVGKTAAKLVREGNFSMKDVVNQTFFIPTYRDNRNEKIDSLVLYHPSYFLRSRTAPWVQKQVSEWKRSVRLFLGDKPPTYKVEKMSCPTHS